MFYILVEINNVPLKIPREGDRWLMAEFVRVDYGSNRLDRVRTHQQVMFLLDIIQYRLFVSFGLSATTYCVENPVVFIRKKNGLIAPLNAAPISKNGFIVCVVAMEPWI